MLACCQGLFSSKLETGNWKILLNPVLVGIQLFVIELLVLPETPRRILPSMEYDIGPPSLSCFIETVLRYSLRENAPPRVS